MKKIFSLSSAILLIAVTQAQYSYIDLNSEPVAGKRIENVASDNSGNLFITGHFDYSLTLGSFTLTNGQSSNAFIAKTSSAGAVLWAKAIKTIAVSGATSTVSIFGVSTDASGNFYITGSFQGKISLEGILLTSTKRATDYTSDVFTAKISATGVFQWGRFEGTANDDFCAGATELGKSISTDGIGNVYVVGQLVYKLFKNTGACNFACNTTQSNTAVTCVYIVKYTASGAKVFEKKYFNSQATGSACGVVLFGNNIKFDGTSFYVSGQIAGSVSFGSATLNTGGEATQNVFLLKMDVNGNTIWVRSVTGGKNISYGVGDGLFVDNNEIYLAGIFYDGTVSFGACSLSTTASTGYRAKYDASSGTCLWAAKDAILYGFGRHADGNIVALLRSANMRISEISAGDGSVINSTVPVMDSNASMSCFSGLARTPDGFAFSLNATGSFSYGGTTISAIGSGDLMLIKYTFPVPPGALAAPMTTKRLSNLIVDPNPASSQITIRNGSNKILGEISIYDMSGRVIYQKSIDGSKAVIDVAKFSSGTYYVTAGFSVTKFLKQ